MLLPDPIHLHSQLLHQTTHARIPHLTRDLHQPLVLLIAAKVGGHGIAEQFLIPLLSVVVEISLPRKELQHLIVGKTKKQ